MSHPKPSAVSAPGKVLLAGGYLVLDRDHTGLVFGLSARIHVVVQQSSQPAAATGGAPQHPVTVVHSPQFIDAEWRYAHKILPHGRGVEITQLERYVLSFITSFLTFSFVFMQAISHHLSSVILVIVIIIVMPLHCLTDILPVPLAPATPSSKPL